VIGVVLLVPYALFGNNKKVAGWIAFFNGLEISLSLVFLEPLFLLTNPFLALFAISPMWRRMNHAAH